MVSWDWTHFARVERQKCSNFGSRRWGRGTTSTPEEMLHRTPLCKICTSPYGYPLSHRAGRPGGRRCRLWVRDPFRPDVAREWLLNAPGASANLAEALCEFADRHENSKLRGQHSPTS